MILLVKAIALNTYREAVRDKVLYNLVLFAIVMIFSSYVLGKISVYQEIKIIKDLGLAAISVFGMVIAIFLGIGLVSKEIDRRTLHSLLSKPVSRMEFLLGKYCGLCFTLLINISVMTTGLYGVLFVMREPFDLLLLQAIFLIYVKLIVLVGIAILFSTFTSAVLAGVFTSFVYVIGYFLADLKNSIWTLIDAPPLRILAFTFYYMLPNFRNFDVKGVVVSGHMIPFQQIVLLTFYGLTYSLLLLVFSTWIFSKRNLK